MSGVRQQALLWLILSGVGAGFATLPAQAASGLDISIPAPSQTTRVEQDLVSGHAADALARIGGLLQNNPNNALALELRCRVQIEEQQWSAAVDSCEAAVKNAPNSSETHFWLGRAYGELAQRSGRISAFLLARKLHVQLEQALAIDPSNLDAYDALGAFYVEAPEVIGGGLKKARALEAKLAPVNASHAHALAAQIAESEKNYPQAEQQWKAAISSSQQPALAWIDLASYYQRRGDMPAMLKAVYTGVALDKSHGLAQVKGAELLVLSGQNFPQAARWFSEYLASGQKSEEAPVFVVHAELAHLLEKMGDHAQADEQLALAKDLAPEYRAKDTSGA